MANQPPGPNSGQNGKKPGYIVSQSGHTVPTYNTPGYRAAKPAQQSGGGNTPPPPPPSGGNNNPPPPPPSGGRKGAPKSSSFKDWLNQHPKTKKAIWGAGIVATAGLWLYPAVTGFLAFMGAKKLIHPGRALGATSNAVSATWHTSKRIVRGVLGAAGLVLGLGMMSQCSTQMEVENESFGNALSGSLMTAYRDAVRWASNTSSVVTPAARSAADAAVNAGSAGVECAKDEDCRDNLGKQAEQSTKGLGGKAWDYYLYGWRFSAGLYYSALGAIPGALGDIYNHVIADLIRTPSDNSPQEKTQQKSTQSVPSAKKSTPATEAKEKSSSGSGAEKRDPRDLRVQVCEPKAKNLEAQYGSNLKKVTDRHWAILEKDFNAQKADPKSELNTALDSGKHVMITLSPINPDTTPKLSISTFQTSAQMRCGGHTKDWATYNGMIPKVSQSDFRKAMYEKPESAYAAEFQFPWYLGSKKHEKKLLP